MKKNNIKKNKFLIIYGIIILIILIIILFVLDDDFIRKHSKFKNYYNNNNTTVTEKKEEFTSYEDQINKLRQNKYKYSYELIHNNITYNCEGIKNKEEDNGHCDLPEKISYTKENYESVYSKINAKFLDVNYIFDSLKEYEPKKEEYKDQRMFIYTIKTSTGTNDITVYTDYNNITKICIAKGYLTYILKYSDIGI